MTISRCIALALLLSSMLPAQSYTVTTFAGGGLPVKIPGTSVDLPTLTWRGAADSAGNLCLGYDHSILKWNCTQRHTNRVRRHQRAGLLRR